jgi:hypothetical protein
MIAELLFGGVIAVGAALFLGLVLGRAATELYALRLALEILSQFRAGLGFWLLPVAVANRPWLPPPVLIGVSAGLIQGVFIARWLSDAAPLSEAQHTRRVGLRQLGAALFGRETRLRGVALSAAALALLHVLSVTYARRLFLGPSPGAQPVSNLTLCLGLAPLLVLSSGELRRRFARSSQ